MPGNKIRVNNIDFDIIEEAIVHREPTHKMTKNKQSRKRNLSASDSELSTTEHENKKTKNSQEQFNNANVADCDNLNDLDLKFLVISLSLELMSAVSTLSKQMTELENRLEQRISQKLMLAVDTKIENEFSNLRQEIKSEIDTMKKRLNSAEKSYASVVKIPKETNTEDYGRGKNIIVKMFPVNKNETPTNNCLKNNVISMVKDGMKIKNIIFEKVERKQSNGPRPGVVIARLQSKQNKVEIMKKKKELRKIQKYRNVYIESDIPYETRVANSNMRTILKEMGKLNDFKVYQGKLVRNFQRNQSQLNGRSIDESIEDILWVKLTNGYETFCICVCYLPPKGSTRTNVPEQFYSDLTRQVYMYQNLGKFYIVGDFNSRCSDTSDFIEGVDELPIRESIDQGSNANGDLLIDFLVDCNICMINDRKGKQDFTCISKRGKSVVDYIFTTHENLNSCIDFNVKTMSDITDCLDLQECSQIPDHSVLQAVIKREATVPHNTVLKFPTNLKRIPNKPKSYQIPNDFLNDDNAREKIEQTINIIENSLADRRDVDEAYNKDNRDPLGYRGIARMSIPCKIYADILNGRLSSWLEDNKILADEQNGFRRDRCCVEHLYALTILITNRKIELHFRCGSSPRSNFDFTCGNTVVKYDSKYRYLGVWIDEHLDWKFTVREVRKSASPALSALYTKFIPCGGMDFDIYEKLYENLVQPVLLYGSSIWGTSEHKQLETVQNRACRYFLGAFKTNRALRGDIGWTIVKTKQNIELMRLFCKFSNLEDDRIVRTIHETNEIISVALKNSY
ncbi:unnamed protein product [Mytilus coruscus]|uniref:Endonuclease/exonuclease/phosphatase domain-containing protein n=1 Tax=Mytilus coruscus TaxID=42192 RepID=A0A6J8BC52_MYTCO|nr:unnamed protein product [Mytilus coruscus]